MTIVADSHYGIGYRHSVCQDYACHGLSPLPYAIVADGCSGSADSDIGARLLARQAARRIGEFAGADHWAPLHRCIATAAAQARLLGLAAGALDATLLIAIWAPGQVRVRVYGDGWVLLQRRDRLDSIEIAYSGNTPFYPAYLADPARLAQYRAVAPVQQRRCREQATEQPYDTPAVFDFDPAELALLAVATDGLGTFSGDPAAIAAELTAFPNLNGPFVQRRLRRVLAGGNVRHADDLALAVLARTTA